MKIIKIEGSNSSFNEEKMATNGYYIFYIDRGRGIEGRNCDQEFIRIKCGTREYEIESFEGDVTLENGMVNLIKLGEFEGAIRGIMERAYKAGVEAGRDQLKSEIKDLLS